MDTCGGCCWYAENRSGFQKHEGRLEAACTALPVWVNTPASSHTCALFKPVDRRETRNHKEKAHCEKCVRLPLRDCYIPYRWGGEDEVCSGYVSAAELAEMMESRPGSAKQESCKG